MRRHSIIIQDDVLRIVRLLRWATRFILVLFFGGEAKRIKALERLLPALEREGLLLAEWHEGEKVYSSARKDRVKPVSMAHEIACALILVLLWRCRMGESVIVPERAFRGFGIVPEGGILYSEERKTMLIYEYESVKDYKRTMKSKITRYKKYLPAMEAKFQRTITVLFVIDIERYRVREFIKGLKQLLDEPILSEFVGILGREVGSVADSDQSAPADGDRFPSYPFFFTDYQTFKSLPIGKALTEKIHFWIDGNEWSLANND